MASGGRSPATVGGVGFHGQSVHEYGTSDGTDDTDILRFVSLDWARHLHLGTSGSKDRKLRKESFNNLSLFSGVVTQFLRIQFKSVLGKRP